MSATPPRIHVLAKPTGAICNLDCSYCFLPGEGAPLPGQRLSFLEQRVTGTLQIWAEPMVQLRVPKLFNLRTDPYERADITSNTYYDWMIDHVYLYVPAQQVVGDFLKTFIEYPPRQKAASFTVDQVMEKLSQHGAGSH